MQYAVLVRSSSVPFWCAAPVCSFGTQLQYAVVVRSSGVQLRVGARGFLVGGSGAGRGWGGRWIPGAVGSMQMPLSGVQGKSSTVRILT